MQLARTHDLNDADLLRLTRGVGDGGTVGLLTFKDSAGVRWRVWRVETPAARAHLMEASYRDGWLVFEREDGSERRRLQQVPDDWSALPPDRLARLCELAIPVRLSPTGLQPATPRSDVRRDR
jgi:hypothetical protein